MKKWKKWKKGIAGILAGAVFLGSMPAAAQNLFIDGKVETAGETLPQEEKSALEMQQNETVLSEDLGGTEEVTVDAVSEGETTVSEESGFTSEEENVASPEEPQIPEEENMDLPEIPQTSEGEEATPQGENDTQISTPEEAPQEETPIFEEESTEKPSDQDVQSGEENAEAAGDIFSDGTEHKNTTESEQEVTIEYPTYDSMTIEELESLDENTAGAATEVLEKMPRRTFALNSSQEMSSWFFDTYYVKQKDPHHVYKTQDFSLKYQMEFQTDYDLKNPGDVVIKIPRKLLTERERDGGREIYPQDIAVPLGGKNEDGTYIQVESRVTPFNYYIEENNLVFYNYKTIQAGTNAAWQVLYRNVDVSRVVNGTTWTLEPTITVIKPVEAPQQQEGLTPTPTPEVIPPQIETVSTTPLTGEVYTTSSLNRVSKDILTIPNKSYGPGFYTKEQIKRVLGVTSLPQKYEEHFYDYVYVGWKVSVDANVVQPVSLKFTDHTTYERDGVIGDGEVVGTNKGDIEYCTKSQAAPVLGDIRIVTAYPRDSVKSGTTVKNTFSVEMTLWDDKIVQTGADDASWVYKDYYFTYNGDDYQAWKYGGADYPGWLNVFDTVETEAEAEAYLDAFPFRTETFMRGYKETHHLNSSKPEFGKRKEGSFYEIETSDGFFAWDKKIDGPSNNADRNITDGYSLHAYSNTSGTGAEIPLGAEDYYIKDLAVHRTDRSYDPWEDEVINTPEFDTGENAVDQTIHVYGAYAQPGENQEPIWKEISTIDWTADKHSNDQIVYISNDTLKQAGNGQYPVAVKTAYKSINYDTHCELFFAVKLRHTSQKIKNIMASDPSNTKAITVVNTARNNFYISGGSQSPKLLNSLYRSSDAVVSYVGIDADADKTARVSIDPINGQVLVDYNLTARSGYNVYSQRALNYLRSKGGADVLFPDLEGPTGKRWTFYDLLPYGMTLDFTKSVIAGRITGLGGNFQDYPQSWNTKDVSVTVDPKKDVIDNWQGTKRTMVKFHIQYKGEDPTVYDRGFWMQSWGVSFRARYDWEDIDLLEKDANICAFTPEDPNLPLVGAAYGNMQIPTTQKEYTPFGLQNGGVRGDKNISSDVKNILYAQNRSYGDIAIASTSTVKKLVRADEDNLNDYGTTAVVENDKSYTYDISVSSGGMSLNNITVFDRLEYAVEDRSGQDAMDFENRNSISQVWQGEFQGLDTNELEAEKIDFKIYYSDKQNAARPGEGSYTTPQEVFEKSGDWTEKNSWTLPLAQVKAIAVELRAKEGKPYVLPSMKTIGFKIKMKAPTELDAEKPYTYNNPSYYSVQQNQPGLGKLIIGNSVRVELTEEKKNVEVVKEFANLEEVPEAFLNQDFQFTMTYPKLEEGGETVYPPFAYKTYTLHRKTADGNWEAVNDDQVRTTDKKGRLTLHAGEKAVFQEVQGGAKILVEEESPFWRVEKTDSKDTFPEWAIRRITFSNIYRPVLYIQKKTQAEPPDKKEEIKNHIFAFEIKASYIDKFGKEVKQDFSSDTVFWLVDKARIDGTIPKKLGERKFNKSGLLEIKPGEVAAVFLDNQDSLYTVKELLDQGSNPEDWLCTEPEKSGKASIKGNKVEITNTYRWKDLILLKEITHQKKEDVEAFRKNLPFTFEVKEVVKEGDKEKEIPITGKEWMLLNSDGSEPAKGELPDGIVEGQEIFGISGKLDEKGRFTCAMANRKVKIKGLEAGKTYVINEVDYKSENQYPDQITTEEQKKFLELYKPVNGGVLEVTMPVYSISKEGTITNDYQMRPLTVSKQILMGEGSSQAVIEASKTRVFTMTVLISGRQLALKPYEIMKNGQKIGEGKTDVYGRFSIKGGESVCIQDAGILGDTFTVTEMQDSGTNGIRFGQLYPADMQPFEGKLVGEGGTAEFINGSGNTLVVAKEYVGGDQAGAEIVHKIMQTPERRTEFAVKAEFILYDENGKEIRSDKMQNYDKGSKITIINLQDGTISSMDWQARERTLTLEPGKMYVLPESILEEWIPATDENGGNGSYRRIASYRITEEKTDYGYLFKEKTDTGGETKTWLHIQQNPQGEVSGNIAEKPLAKLINQITVPQWTSGTLLEKRTAVDTKTRLPQTVAESAVLTLRLEKYQANTWLPAAGIPYLQTDRLIHNGSEFLVDASYEVKEGIYGVTASDGMITCKKAREAFAYPVVYFPKDKVYLNLYGTTQNGKEIPEGTLRLVEIPELSDPEWGYLTGYGKAGGLSYSMDTTEGTILYNRTGGSPVEIEKNMATDSDDTFTMLLKQVLSQSTDPITLPEHIRYSQAVPGIPYIVYERETGKEISHGETGKNGEIYLKAGQYARLELSEDTKWTVEEMETITTSLEKLEGTLNGRLTKLSNNLMLIHQPGETMTVGTITYNANGGTFGNGENAPTLQSIPYYLENGVPKPLGDDVKEPVDANGNSFDGWYCEPDCITPFDITKDFNGKTDLMVYAKWKKPADIKYAVAIYGIREDKYKKEDGGMDTVGLTFGPATGADYRGIEVKPGYKAHLDEGEAGHCIHWESWEDIIAQSKKNPEVYRQCLEHGCTKAVELYLNDKLKGKDFPPMPGDGVSGLQYAINYRHARWVPQSMMDACPWDKCRVRATLNGREVVGESYALGADALKAEECLLTCFPLELQEAIVPKEVIFDYNTAYNKYSLGTTYDKLWLFSGAELYTTGYDGKRPDVGKPYSRSWPHPSKNLIVYNEYDGNRRSSWLRNLKTGVPKHVQSFGDRGAAGRTLANFTPAISPGFCIP